MSDLKQRVVDRIAAGPQAQVWTPVDFLDLGSRDAVDKALQRLVRGGQLRRIDRGLYDTPRINRLTKRPAVADYGQIVDALARRDQVRMLVDGLTAAKRPRPDDRPCRQRSWSTQMRADGRSNSTT